MNSESFVEAVQENIKRRFIDRFQHKQQSPSKFLLVSNTKSKKFNVFFYRFLFYFVSIFYTEGAIKTVSTNYLYGFASCFLTAAMHLAIVGDDREIGSVMK